MLLNGASLTVTTMGAVLAVGVGDEEVEVLAGEEALQPVKAKEPAIPTVHRSHAHVRFGVFICVSVGE